MTNTELNRQSSFLIFLMKYLSLFIWILLISSCKTSNKLSTTDYLELGIQHYDSIWTIKDYEQATIVLTDLKSESFELLPGYSDKKSGLIFKRIIAQENLRRVLQNQILTKEERIKLVDSFYRLLLIYFDENRNEQKYHREIREICIMFIEVYDLIFDELYSLSYLNEPRNQESLDKIRNAYTTSINSFLNLQSENEVFDKNDLNALSDSICRSIEKYPDWINEDQIPIILNKIRSLSLNGDTQIIRENYSNILSELKFLF